jgi:intein-encoded DNA endonuclease-like protein
MKREQAIFFEVLDDLDIGGVIEPAFFAYDDFVRGFDFDSATDLDIHSRAVVFLKKYRIDNVNTDFYEIRQDVLDKLNLEHAQWEYRDEQQYLKID